MPHRKRSRSDSAAPAGPDVGPEFVEEPGTGGAYAEFNRGIDALEGARRDKVAPLKKRIEELQAQAAAGQPSPEVAK